MSELFVGLFSEEIPAKLQINARNELKKNIRNFLQLKKNPQKKIGHQKLIHHQCKNLVLKQKKSPIQQL